MPALRITMRKTREILRLRWAEGVSGRAAATSCNVSPSTVSNALDRATLAGLSWPLPEDLDDAALEALLYPGQQPNTTYAVPDYAAMYRELKRDKHVTLQLLWQEYRAKHPEDGYGYSQYCTLFRRWRGQLDVVMRQSHRAGDKLFVDYAGRTIGVTNPETGEVTMYQVFVATLGASNYTYVELHEAQNVRSWIGAHIRAFEHLGGVPRVLVPDNLKAGVTKPSFYDPDINPTYQELAEHYGTVVIPARVRKPRDKAKVENGVLQVERWVLAPLRKQTFHSIEELRNAVRERCHWLNSRPLSKLDGTRRSLLEELERPALKPLPRYRYSISEWKTKVAVNIDYHFEFDGHYYSVPHIHARKHVDVRATSTTVECYLNRVRIASHARSYQRGRYTTKAEHMSPAHRQYAEWNPERFINWAGKIGVHTAEVVKRILDSRRHPEQGYRSCLGVLRLGKTFGNDRLEAACRRACRIRSFSYKSVKSILNAGLDKLPLPDSSRAQPIIHHDNIRGADTYQ